MTNPSIVESQLRTSMLQIWRSYIGHDVSEAEFGLLDKHAPIIRGHMQIDCAWEGCLCLECSEPLAKDLAAAMFGLAAEDLTHEDVCDALGEVTNMLGGGLKYVLPPPVNLSLPIVENWLDSEAPWFKRRLTTGAGFRCGKEPFRVGIVKKEGNL